MRVFQIQNVCVVSLIFKHYLHTFDYGLDGQGLNPSGDEIFRRSRPALGFTQPPVKWVPVLSRW